MANGSGKRIAGPILVFLGLSIALAGLAGLSINFSVAALVVLWIGAAGVFWGLKMFRRGQEAGGSAADSAGAGFVPTPGALFSMQGVQDILEVFEDTVTITPQGVFGFLNKGLQGTKTIPFASITATQFRAAGPVVSGYLQFSIPGGNESRRGVLAASQDENTFMFAGQQNNELASRIKNHIEMRLRELRTPPAAHAPASLADELHRLAAMRDQGLLSEDEFARSKAKLLG